MDNGHAWRLIIQTMKGRLLRTPPVEAGTSATCCEILPESGVIELLLPNNWEEALITNNQHLGTSHFLAKCKGKGPAPLYILQADPFTDVHVPHTVITCHRAVLLFHPRQRKQQHCVRAQTDNKNSRH